MDWYEGRKLKLSTVKMVGVMLKGILKRKAIIKARRSNLKIVERVLEGLARESLFFRRHIQEITNKSKTMFLKVKRWQRENID